MEILKAFGVFLYERVWLSKKSTILGLLVVAIGEGLNFASALPNPKVHLIVSLISAPFFLWKDQAVKDGTIKLIALFLFVSFGAFAQGSPRSRTDAAAAQAVGTPDPEALAGAISSDPNAVPPDLTPPPPAPKFGGCVKSGRVCFGPSASISVAAINLTSGKVEGAFAPGFGYGFTVNPGAWSAFGADAHFVLDPGAQQATGSILFKAVNGYLRAGISKGFVGDRGLRLIFGSGIDL